MRKSILCVLCFAAACSVAACSGLKVKASYEYPAPVQK